MLPKTAQAIAKIANALSEKTKSAIELEIAKKNRSIKVLRGPVQLTIAPHYTPKTNS